MTPCMVPDSPACPCGCGDYQVVWRYDAPPPGEVRFPSASGEYRRTVLRCTACGHFVSRHAMDLEGIYGGEYLDATYGEQGLERVFTRVTGLPPGQSDNEGRVRRVLHHADLLWSLAGRAGAPSLLDVGSGTAVFAFRMGQAGWRVTALDPDPRAVSHARRVAGVEGLCRDFALQGAPGRYDAVSFNKVLEHVADPVAMLARAAGLLNPRGFVYVELPDAEAACAHGREREEFFIDHHHAFSMASTAILAARAGFVAQRVERLREPSGKFTLYAFLTPQEQDASGME